MLQGLITQLELNFPRTAVSPAFIAFIQDALAATPTLEYRSCHHQSRFVQRSGYWIAAYCTCRAVILVNMKETNHNSHLTSTIATKPFCFSIFTVPASGSSPTSINVPRNLVKLNPTLCHPSDLPLLRAQADPNKKSCSSTGAESRSAFRNANANRGNETFPIGVSSVRLADWRVFLDM